MKKSLLSLLLLLSFNAAYPMGKAAADQITNPKEEASDSEDENSSDVAQKVALTFPHVQFSPDLQDLLIKLISEEKGGILGAWFRFTLQKPAEAIVARMKKQKIKSFIIVDESNIKEDFCSPLQLIAKNGGKIRKKTKKRNPQSPGNFETMHHKFMIFYNNISDKKLLWTGSFNATGQADLKNCENAVILDDPTSIQKFEQEFKTVWALGEQVAAKDLVSAKDKNKNNGFARRMNGIA
jgi:phosphatidylserine/phosphatidylglycerophosphate/cardiolipin synthase-like enzyme